MDKADRQRHAGVCLPPEELGSRDPAPAAPRPPLSEACSGFRYACMEAPRVPMDRLADVLSRGASTDDWVLWRDPGASAQAAVLAWGTRAECVQASATTDAQRCAEGDRFAVVQRWLDAWMSRVQVDNPESEQLLARCPQLRPRAYGGFSFLEGDHERRWQAFPDLRFVVPMWSYHVIDGRAYVSGDPGALEPGGMVWTAIERCVGHEGPQADVARGAGAKGSEADDPVSLGSTSLGSTSFGSTSLGSTSPGSKSLGSKSPARASSASGSSEAVSPCRSIDGSAEHALDAEDAHAAGAGDDGNDTWAERETWHRLVDAALGTIAAGELRKVVVARAEVRVLRTLPSLARLWLDLCARQPGCAVFLFARVASAGSGLAGNAIADGASEPAWHAFVGATPELLLSRQGNVIRSEALAGSCARGEEESLLASSKNLREQQWVRDAVLDGLRHVCTELDAPALPRLRRLPHVSHLHTPIVARLDPREASASPFAPLCSLLRVLHPTPAVGGFPREAAVAWLRTHEPLDRGWYAAPIGYVDAAGDGLFCVALRSALLSPAQSDGVQARLFAGAGIVAGSEAEAEYRETSLKLNAMRAVLQSQATKDRRGEASAPAHAKGPVAIREGEAEASPRRVVATHGTAHRSGDR